MIYRVTHIDEAGHRRRARVTAVSLGNCLDQVNAAFGDARRVSCVRLKTSPVLHLVQRATPQTDERSAPCVH